MKVHTTCRNAKLTPALKRFIEERLAKLERFATVAEAHVVLETQKYRQLAEVLLKAQKKELVAREESNDFMVSIDRAVVRLERQLKKVKEKRTTRILHAGTRPNGDETRGAVRSAARAALAKPEAEVEGEDEEGEIMATRGTKSRSRVARNIDPARVRLVPARPHGKPLSLDEATLELLENGAEFIAFTNSETEQLNVLYRRKDGALGWIAPGGRRGART